MDGNLLIIDNYDSFTYNVYHLFANVCERIVVKRPNEITLDGIIDMDPCLIVLSPGPGTPENAHFSLQVIDVFKGLKPIFGICLGMQCIVSYFNGEVKSLNSPVHGMSSTVVSTQTGFLKNLPKEFQVGRYHSLFAFKLSDELEILATTKEDSIPMAVRHKDYKIAGVQFHPESFLTKFGVKIAEEVVLGNI
jgi:anthranilate synthase/aminodeoxychorismate synthase-like glutamine amidotransferase